MSKYSELLAYDLNCIVFEFLHGDGPDWIYYGDSSLHFIKVVDCFNSEDGHYQEEEIYDRFDAANKWEDCYPVLDALLSITTGINLKSDGTATTEIEGKQVSVGGGHCRAICELYLMAHDAEVNCDN